ncbi:MAG: aldo/keto reductase [Hydrogenophilaceae bacterium]|jgi:hypothetical protein|nr:aldo/keto reductase [Hydrogenophilaceae bacterium]
MLQRHIGGTTVSAIGLGCMNLSHAYGEPPPREAALRVIRRALDLGVTHFDTAALYGFGANEILVGEALKPHRSGVFLASKCGMTGVDGKRVIDGRPETLVRTCEDSLSRLQTDVIDLYYLHRWDKTVPIEDSVGALAGLVRAGKVRMIGLSEVSAATLRRAHAVHPIAAVQSEYSLWTRNPEIAVLRACRELGVAFVAFSPLGRGALAGDLDPSSFSPRDIRTQMPRFQPPHWPRNAELMRAFAQAARERGCTRAQLALAWLLRQDPDLSVIPGTTSARHLEENAGAGAIELSPQDLAWLDALISPAAVSGPRYNAATQAEIDTEDA